MALRATSLHRKCCRKAAIARAALGVCCEPTEEQRQAVDFALYVADLAAAYPTKQAALERLPTTIKPKESAVGLVSPLVHTATRNCTGDEGGPFGFGDQVTDPKPPRAAVVKSHGRERRGNAGTMIPAGMIERGERKRTASEASKAD